MDVLLLASMLVVLACLVGLSGVLVRLVVRIERMMEARCPACGYEEVRSGVCPECGKRRRVRLARSLTFVIVLAFVGVPAGLHVRAQVEAGNAIRAAPTWAIVSLWPDPDGLGGAEVLRRDEAGWLVPSWVRRHASDAEDLRGVKMVGLLARHDKLRADDEVLVYEAAARVSIGSAMEDLRAILESDALLDPLRDEARLGRVDLSRLQVARRATWPSANRDVVNHWLILAAASEEVNPLTALDIVRNLRGDLSAYWAACAEQLRRPDIGANAEAMLLGLIARPVPEVGRGGRTDRRLTASEVDAIALHTESAYLDVRVLVAATLGAAPSGNQRAIELLVGLGRDEDANVRRSAANSLANVADDATKWLWEPTLERMAEEEGQVGATAGRTLAHLRGESVAGSATEDRELYLRQREAEIERMRRRSYLGG